MSLIGILIWLLIVCAILGIAFWALNQIPGIPPPIRVVIIVIIAIVCILVLLSLGGALTGTGPMLRLG